MNETYIDPSCPYISSYKQLGNLVPNLLSYVIISKGSSFLGDLVLSPLCFRLRATVPSKNRPSVPLVSVAVLVATLGGMGGGVKN